MEDNELNKSAEILSKFKHASNFLPTSRRIVQFSNGKGPGPNARVVYIDGAFDLFHAGHVEVLPSIKDGIVTDWDIVESIWDHAFR